MKQSKKSIGRILFAWITVVATIVALVEGNVYAQRYANLI